MTNAGHGHPGIIKRMKEWIDKPLLHGYSYPTKIRADYVKANEMTPSYRKSLAFGGGAESSEAIRLANIHEMNFSPRKNVIVGGKGKLPWEDYGGTDGRGQDAGKSWIGNLDQVSF